MKRNILICFFGVLLSNCGGGGGGDNDKNLFSLWYENSANTPLDLTGGDFGVDMDFYVWLQTDRSVTVI